MTEPRSPHPANPGPPAGERPLTGPERRRVVRALAGLFWGLPLALVTGVLTARTPLLGELRFGPALLACGLVAWSCHLLAAVRTDEPHWQARIEGARVLAVILCGLAPFLHWFQLAPAHLHYAGCAFGFLLAGLWLLARISGVLVTLAGWIEPDRLESEARHFRGVVLPLLGGVFVVSLGWVVLNHSPLGPRARASLVPLLVRVDLTSLLMLVAAVALNMAMAWKLKDAVLEEVFEEPPAEPAAQADGVAAAAADPQPASADQAADPAPES
ncbi:MAG: hypothetical protein D6766_06875 [Verrucomicrobia bacterium]|nr:MAG: hypothetical protein D6766_06875 [Verrucomicrobiota bacterium]